MPRILYISGSINWGAPGRIVEQTGLLAQEYGYDVLVAHSSRNENPSQLPHFVVTTKRQEMAHALGARVLDLHGLLSARQTRALVKRIKAYNPDIIHLHNIHGYYCNFKVLFEYLDRIDKPIVWTMHDCWPFTGRCFHFEGINCFKWMTGCYDCEAEAGYTVSRCVDRSKALFSLKKRLFSSVKNMTIVPVSDWLAKYLKESFLRNYSIRTIHNGVDLVSFRPMNSISLKTTLNVVGKTVLLGVASPWNERKGLFDFFKLRTMLSIDRYVIILVGLTPQQVKKLPNGIIGVTRTESLQQLAEYYSMADLFLNLTYLDTFPTVNLEALACGTPVITYKTGGSPEAIDSSTGVVVEQGDLVALSDAIQRLANRNAQESQLMRKRCRERAQNHFDKDNCFKAYIDLYNEIIHNLTTA